MWRSDNLKVTLTACPEDRDLKDSAEPTMFLIPWTKADVETAARTHSTRV